MSAPARDCTAAPAPAARARAEAAAPAARASHADAFHDGAVAHVDPHRQRIDEHPQHPIRAPPTLHPPEQHCPEHHVLAPRRARQHQRPRQVHHARRAHPQLARLLPHARRQRPGLEHAPLRSSGAIVPPPSPWTSTSPNGVVGSSMSPSILRKNASCCSPSGSRRSAPAPRSFETPQGPKQLSPTPLRDQRRLSHQQLQRRVIDRQVVRQDHKQPPPIRLVLRRERA